MECKTDGGKNSADEPESALRLNFVMIWSPSSQGETSGDSVDLLTIERAGDIDLFLDGSPLYTSVVI